MLDQLYKQIVNTVGVSAFSIKHRLSGSARFGRSWGGRLNAFFVNFAMTFVPFLLNATSGQLGQSIGFCLCDWHYFFLPVP